MRCQSIIFKLHQPHKLNLFYSKYENQLNYNKRWENKNAKQ